MNGIRRMFTQVGPGVSARKIRAAMGVPAQEVFEVIAAGDMVKAKKPAPDVFQLALHGLDLQGKACLALEDSRNGLKSARAAGIPCLICPSAYTDQDDFTGATAVVHSFEQVERIAGLNALFAGANLTGVLGKGIS